MRTRPNMAAYTRPLSEEKLARCFLECELIRSTGHRMGLKHKLPPPMTQDQWKNFRGESPLERQARVVPSNKHRRGHPCYTLEFHSQLHDDGRRHKHEAEE
jgi:hypothetical protein